MFRPRLAFMPLLTLLSGHRADPIQDDPLWAGETISHVHDIYHQSMSNMDHSDNFRKMSKIEMGFESYLGNFAPSKMSDRLQMFHDFRYANYL